MTNSNFHPESWNPMWSVSSIIQGIQSFMASDELTTGGLKSPESEHKKLAACSMAYNQKMFADLFSGDITEAFVQADTARIESEKNAPSLASKMAANTIRGRNKTIKKEETAGVDEEDDKEDASDKELTPEEIEKRRKKNAKKRAKQKIKKQEAVASSEGVETKA
jgi:ubiquitin-conjugating enzyme E2 J2